MKTTIDISKFRCSEQPVIRTGVDLHDTPRPAFTYDNAALPYSRHQVGFDWIISLLPIDCMNKMLYCIDASDERVALFGAVVDGYGVLFIVDIN